MADRKEPPFYNDHSIGTFHYKLPFYDTMDLFIETLTGTCFELRVSPFEAVISVKAKIQRLEGIPVAQQHLIWNSLELDDEYCLHDYGISEGCTLKLVLAMRGGPINTRRVTMEEPARDVVDMMEGSREEPWEKGSASKQVTFLVYREGEQLNFFRVVDRGDGTLTPLSEALSGGSVYNVYTEEEEYGLASSAMQQGLENSVTMNKMKLLKAKMEDMNLNKKKSSKLKPRPPLGPHVSSLGPSSTRRQHRLLRPLPQGDQPRHADAQLPPARDQEPVQPPSSSPLPMGRRVPPSCPNSSAAAAASSSSSSCYMLQEEEAWETCPPFAKVRPPPKVSRLDAGGARLMRDCVYPQLPPLSTRGHPEGSLEASEHGGEALGLGLSEEVPTQPAATALGELMSEPLCLEERVLQHQLGPPASLLNPWTQLGSPPSLLPFPPGSRDPPPPFAFSAVGFPPSPPPPPRLVTADWPGQGPEAVASVGRAREEPTGPLDCPGLLASLLTRAAGSGERLRPGPGLSLVLPATSALRQGPLEPRPPSMPNNIQLLQEDLVRKVSPLHRAAASHMASKSLGFAGGASSSVRRLGTPTYHLPPVKAPMGSKKKTSKHCFLCGRKTGLATSYECRCGNNFCSTHRYAETHDCTYDYKSAGRRFLQEANPIVSAPKLPKI